MWPLYETTVIPKTASSTYQWVFHAFIGFPSMSSALCVSLLCGCLYLTQCLCCSSPTMIIIIRKISRRCSCWHADHLLFWRCVDDIQLICVLRIVSLSHVVFVSQTLAFIPRDWCRMVRITSTSSHNTTTNPCNTISDEAFTTWEFNRRTFAHCLHGSTSTHTRDKLESDWTNKWSTGRDLIIIYFGFFFSFYRYFVGAVVK